MVGFQCIVGWPWQLSNIPSQRNTQTWGRETDQLRLPDISPQISGQALHAPWRHCLKCMPSALLRSRMLVGSCNNCRSLVRHYSQLVGGALWGAAPAPCMREQSAWQALRAIAPPLCATCVPAIAAWAVRDCVTPVGCYAFCFLCTSPSLGRGEGRGGGGGGEGGTGCQGRGGVVGRLAGWSTNELGLSFCCFLNALCPCRRSTLLSMACQWYCSCRTLHLSRGCSSCCPPTYPSRPCSRCTALQLSSRST